MLYLILTLSDWGIDRQSNRDWITATGAWMHGSSPRLRQVSRQPNYWARCYGRCDEPLFEAVQNTAYSFEIMIALERYTIVDEGSFECFLRCLLCEETCLVRLEDGAFDKHLLPRPAVAQAPRRALVP